MRTTTWILTGIGLTACVHDGAATSTKVPEFSLSREAERGEQPGGTEHFTGATKIAMLFVPNGSRDFSGAYVTFEPGARTAWHSHPAGQTLVVTEGSGWVQLEGQPRVEMKPGDVVWTPPNVRHWHGATETSSMTHIALQGAVEGSAVDWAEHVTDAQYRGRDSD